MKFNVGFVFIVALLDRSLAGPALDNLASNFEVETSRIVGGAIASDGSAPYAAALTTGWVFRSLMCGGSLISERHVLTAAHCIEALYISGSLSRSLRMIVGTNRWKRGGQSYAVTRNITHQHYQASVVKNDVGLLVIRSRVKLSARVEPVALSFEYVGAGVAVRAVGWGRTEYMGPISDNLLELKMVTVDDGRCIAEVAQVAAAVGVTAPPVDPALELCALHSTGRGLCNGDSGSALVRWDSSQQIGVVSWGLPCARGAPDVFLRISAYRDWIMLNVNE